MLEHRILFGRGRTNDPGNTGRGFADRGLQRGHGSYRWRRNHVPKNNSLCPGNSRLGSPRRRRHRRRGCGSRAWITHPRYHRKCWPFSFRGGRTPPAICEAATCTPTSRSRRGGFRCCGTTAISRTPLRSEQLGARQCSTPSSAKACVNSSDASVMGCMVLAGIQVDRQHSCNTQSRNQ